MQASDRPTFYYDLGSPFGALGAFRVDDVLPVAPEWKPVWIVPIIGASGRQWQRTWADQQSRLQDVETRARERGLPPWKWPRSFFFEDGEDWLPTNTLALMRLATLADQRGVGREFALRVYALEFHDGLEVAQLGDEVIAAAVECGLDEAEARAAPGDQAIKDALRETTDEAIARGAIGIPTVVVGDQAFWGDDRLEEAAEAVVATV